MNGTEAHEQRLSALMSLTNTKDTFTKLACEFLLGRNVEVEEVKPALRDVQAARTELAALDGAA